MRNKTLDISKKNKKLDPVNLIITFANKWNYLSRPIIEKKIGTGSVFCHSSTVLNILLTVATTDTSFKKYPKIYFEFQRHMFSQKDKENEMKQLGVSLLKRFSYIFCLAYGTSSTTVFGLLMLPYFVNYHFQVQNVFPFFCERAWCTIKKYSRLRQLLQKFSSVFKHTVQG